MKITVYSLDGVPEEITDVSRVEMADDPVPPPAPQPRRWEVEVDCYGPHVNTIRSIIRGETWAHLREAADRLDGGEK